MADSSEPPPLRVRIAVAPERVLTILSIVVFGLTVLSSLGQFAKYGLGHDYVFGFVPLFYLNQEGNVPTWFSSTMFLSAASLLAWIAIGKAEARDPFAAHWKWLAVIFVLLAIDEIAGMHEMLSEPLRRSLHVGGLLYFAWVIPALAVLLLLAVVYFRLWLSLPGRIRWLFFLAAATFVGSAAGLELFEGFHAERFGRENIRHVVLCSVQELFELVGIVIFVYALLAYLRDCRAVVEVAAATPKAEPYRAAAQSRLKFQREALCEVMRPRRP